MNTFRVFLWRKSALIKSIKSLPQQVFKGMRIKTICIIAGGAELALMGGATANAAPTPAHIIFSKRPYVYMAPIFDQHNFRF